MSLDQTRANIKLAISGGQNEPRDAIARTIWALLSNKDQLELVRSNQASMMDAFEEYSPQVIGMSALLTTTMPNMGRTVSTFEDMGLRDQVRLMVGGAPVTPDFADEIIL